jgi:hypothetical protein
VSVKDEVADLIAENPLGAVVVCVAETKCNVAVGSSAVVCVAETKCDLVVGPQTSCLSIFFNRIGRIAKRFHEYSNNGMLLKLARRNPTMEQAKETKAVIRHFSSILYVTNRKRTLEYYRDLGFACDDLLGFVQRDGFELIIHETNNSDAIRPNNPIHGDEALDIYSMVYGVEKLYEEFMSKGANILYPIRVTEYDMKEFAIQDPDGYSIGFGEALND